MVTSQEQPVGSDPPGPRGEPLRLQEAQGDLQVLLPTLARRAYQGQEDCTPEDLGGPRELRLKFGRTSSQWDPRHPRHHQEGEEGGAGEEKKQKEEEEGIKGNIQQ